MQYYIYINAKKLNKFDSAAVAEYTKRLSSYCKVKQIYLPAESLPAVLQKANLSNIFGYYTTNDYQLDTSCSTQLATELSSFALHGTPKLYLFVGYTYSQQLTTSSNLKPLCLTTFDMSPSLSSVVIHEQLYRAYRIIHHQPYHK